MKLRKESLTQFNVRRVRRLIATLLAGAGCISGGGCFVFVLISSEDLRPTSGRKDPAQAPAGCGRDLSRKFCRHAYPGANPSPSWISPRDDAALRYWRSSRQSPCEMLRMDYFLFNKRRPYRADGASQSRGHRLLVASNRSTLVSDSFRFRPIPRVRVTHSFPEYCAAIAHPRRLHLATPSYE